MRFNLRNRLGALYRTLAIKITLLAIVFLVVPIILYRLFQIGDAQQGEILQRAVEQQGNLIASFLRPRLEHFKDEAPDVLQNALNDIITEGTSVKVLVRSERGEGTTGFLYVAAAPTVSSD